VRNIGVLTTGRADYGICRPILQAIEECPNLKLQLMVTGMHLSPEFGLSVKEIEGDGFEVCEQVEILLSSDTPAGTAKSMGLALLGFAQVFSRSRPDILLVVGDRFEVHAAVSATVPFNIPIAHVHGGEITEGAIDDLFRHSITKMSHLHFATTREYARRIAQMGEEEWRISVTGAPGLDNFISAKIPTREDIGRMFEIEWDLPMLLVTYHPVTRTVQALQGEVTPLLKAISQLDVQAIFTFPNADAGGRAIISAIKVYQQENNRVKVAINASQNGYLGLMKYASAMVGNSSSGIIEAPFFELPVVNIGPRQDGRIRAGNVIDVENDEKKIKASISIALSTEFQSQLRGLRNPYGVGRASEKIVNVLQEIEVDSQLLSKKFIDNTEAGSRAQ
jgi:GDP/UDP-N,N'-diacetylbacillosamine 2-epimerase (hydrolysing)